MFPCVSTGQAGRVLCIRQRAYHTSFLSRQSEVIASFLLGACTVQMDFCQLYIFEDICGNFACLLISVYSADSHCIELYVFTWTEAGRMWPSYGGV